MTRKRKKHDNHARLSCSSAGRWLTCPASVAASENKPRAPSSAAAEEGTLAHSVLEAAMLLGLTAEDVMEYEYHGDVEIPTEMRKAVASAVTVAHRWQLEHPNGVVFVEEEVNPGQFIDRKDIWGTGDLIMVDLSALHLTIYDLKYGRKRVSAVDNPQMKLYATGALVEHFAKKDWGKVHVFMGILQDRVKQDKFDQEHETTGLELLQWMMDTVAPAAKQTHDASGPRVSGDHCFFCPASGGCPALTRRIYDVAKVEFATLTDDPATGQPEMLSDEDMLTALELLPLIETWARAIEKEATQRALRGAEFPGYAIVYRALRDKWSEGIDWPALLRKHKLSTDTYYPRSPVTVGQMKMLLKRAKVPDEVRTEFEALVSHPDPEVTIASESGNRRAVSPESYGDYIEERTPNGNKR